MPLWAVWETAPVAVLVSLAYLVLLAASMFLAGILVTVSLVIRHSEAAKKETVH